jgi:hypothetical protein
MGILGLFILIVLSLTDFSSAGIKVLMTVLDHHLFALYLPNFSFIDFPFILYPLVLDFNGF